MKTKQIAERLVAAHGDTPMCELPEHVFGSTGDWWLLFEAAGFLDAPTTTINNLRWWGRPANEVANDLMEQIED